MNYSKSNILFIFMAAFVFSVVCGSCTSDKKPGHLGNDLPEFSLKDPRGKAFTKNDILKNGAVFVVTAPIVSNIKDQEEWAEYLKATKHDGKGRLIFLQDMSSSYFSEKAISEMKKKSDPGEDPLLLIDSKGEVRKKLEVEKGKTMVLVYDKNGKCIHEEKGKPGQKSASEIWKSLDD